jgi:hypothetical protein
MSDDLITEDTFLWEGDTPQGCVSKSKLKERQL